MNYQENDGLIHDSVAKLMDEIIDHVVKTEKVEKPNKKKLQGGNICCIKDCHTTSRRNKGVSLFKPTNLKNDYHIEWRRKINQIILRHRTPDKKYRELVEKRRIFVCEKHYTNEDSVWFGLRQKPVCAI